MNTGEPLFDPRRLFALRERALRMARTDAGFLLNHVADEMVGRLSATNRTFTRAVDFLTPGPGLGAALAKIAPGLGIDHIAHADWLAGGKEIETVLAPESRNLVVSAFGLHWIDDLPGALALIRRVLKPDGLFMAVLPAEGTLGELREALIAAEAELSGGASQRIDPFADVRQAGSLLQGAGFALPVADIERLVVRYDSVAALVADLRAMGATSALAENRRPLPRAVPARLEAIYAERYSDPDGRIRASFNLLHLTGWAPHESQQQPLKPGSAEVNLAEALRK
ncbi:MAG: methyltransferase domain-containing protein [Salaquimonas sp.]|jgi:SAM-dependent methyltransferase|nr:methyltransferase domain-containing protein [Salaquimonas sp.]